jgi:hypothetical protein
MLATRQDSSPEFKSFSNGFDLVNDIINAIQKEKALQQKKAHHGANDLPKAKKEELLTSSPLSSP